MIGAGPEAVYSGKLLEQVKDDDRTVLTKGVVLDSEYHIETVDRPRTFMSVSPNPPKDTDGRREGSGRGWVRELQGRWPGVLG